MSFSLHSSTENLGGGRRSGSLGSNSSSSRRVPVKSSMGLMSAKVSARPSFRKSSKESRWMATRSGRARTSSRLAKEKRSGVLEREGKGYSSLGDGCGRPGTARARRDGRSEASVARGAGTATCDHIRGRAQTQPSFGGPGGRVRPRAGEVKVFRVPRRPPPGLDYLSSTLAPASSSWALAFSASSLDTRSSTGLGAPSTRSLASLRPRLVRARTSLMTWIFLSPAAVRTTSNSSFSSSAGAASPPPPPAGATPATATGAAAVTPNFSSKSLRSSDSSRTVMLEMASRISSLVAIGGSPSLLLGCFGLGLVGVGRGVGGGLSRGLATGLGGRFGSGVGRGLGGRFGSGVGRGLGGRFGSGVGRGLGGGVADGVDAGGGRLGGLGGLLGGAPDGWGNGLGGLGRRSGGFGGGGFGRGRRGTGGPGLVDQGLESVRQVPGQGLQEAGELLHGGGQGPGHPGQEHLSRGQLGQGGGPVGADHVAPEQAPLDDQGGVGPRVVPQGLGHGSGVAVDEGDGGGSLEQADQLVEAEVARREADQGVLVDLVLATNLTQVPAQLGQLGHLEASVLGQDGAGGGVEALAHLFDHRHLLRPGVLHRLPRWEKQSGRPPRAATNAQERPGVRLVRRVLRDPLDARWAHLMSTAS